MKKYIILLFTMFLNACESSNTNPADKITINYAVSFGMCVGPCTREMKITQNTLDFKVITTTARGGNGDRTEKTYSETLSNAEWNLLVNSVNFDEFKKLNAQIGCPDCADGGAENIEIINNDVSHKVKIEFGADIPALRELLKQLRAKRETYEKKYLNF